jgi:hypothetical protein
MERKLHVTSVKIRNPPDNKQLKKNLSLYKFFDMGFHYENLWWVKSKKLFSLLNINTHF